MALPGLFVMGTDTGVGKTRVAAGIARALGEEGRRVGVLKPLATGADRAGEDWRCADAEVLSEALGGAIPRARVAPLVFEEPLAPAVAARRRGEPLDRARVERAVADALAWWSGRAEVMIVEGIGGLLTPVADDATLADLAVALDYPLVIVARRGLGTLNHTLLTVEAALRRGLRVAGLVLNAPEPEAGTIAEATNAEELARRLDAIPVLAELPYHDDPTMLSIDLGRVDWYDRALLPRGSMSPEGGREDSHPGVIPDAGSKDLPPGEVPGGGESILGGVRRAMASNTTSPPPGAPHPDAPRHQPPSSSEIEAGAAGEPKPPGAVTSSDDELSKLLAASAAQPDPMLGAFASDEVPAAPPPPPDPEAPVAEMQPEERAPEAFDGVAALNVFTASVPIQPVLEPVPPVAVGSGAREPTAAAEPPAVDIAPPGVSAGSIEAFPDLILTAQPASTAKAAPKRREEDDEEYEDDVPPRGAPWPLFMLVLSIASASTIGLIWVLWSGRKFRESEGDLNPPAITAPALAPAPDIADPGRRADQSRKVVPPPPIAADHLTTLGKSLRMGSLEATPLGVSSGDVTLQRTFNTVQYRSGGEDALKLELRLKNVSTDTIFTPLDEAFLRERDRGILDSFIETTDGGQIEMFPLAVSSEWSIVGQEFRELKPGGSYETVIVSAPDLQERKTSEMTWRVRLRTGINQTDTMGVRFRADEIKEPEGSREDVSR